MNVAFVTVVAMAPSDEVLLKIVGGVLVALLVITLVRYFFRPLTPEVLLPYISTEGMLVSTLVDDFKIEHPFTEISEVHNLLEEMEEDGLIQTSYSHHHHQMVKRTDAGTKYLQNAREKKKT